MGTILFVSHDRYFLDKIATAILEFNKDKTRYYDLTYKEYLEKAFPPSVNVPPKLGIKPTIVFKKVDFPIPFSPTTP